jgi:RNA polymerase sigma-70 factor (ECF subfamily)
LFDFSWAIGDRRKFSMEIVPKVQEEIPRKIKSELPVTYLKGSRPTSGVMTVSEYNQSVKDFADRLYRFALKNLNDTDLAKDFVQDAYEKLWMRIDQVDNNKVKSYLFRTVVNAQIDRSRRAKLQQNHLASLDVNPTQEHTSFDVQEKIDEGVNRLTEIQRTVLTLRDYEGYSYHEIAEMTELSEDQVKVYIFRARKFLKAYIGKVEVLI